MKQVCIAFFLLFSLTFSAAFAADEIEVELKNGQKLRASRVLLDGQKVKMMVEGAEITKSQDEVRRVEAVLQPSTSQGDADTLRKENAKNEETIRSLRSDQETLRVDLAKYKKVVQESVLSEPEAKRASRQQIENLTTENETLKKQLAEKKDAAPALQPDATWAEEKKELKDLLAQAQKNEELAKSEMQELQKKGHASKVAYSVKETPSAQALKSIRGDEMTRVAGSVTNDSNEPGRRVVLEVSAYDANNKVLSMAYTYVSGVQPGQARPFLVDLDIPVSKIAHVTALAIEGN
jgi:hypothetical protein